MTPSTLPVRCRTSRLLSLFRLRFTQFLIPDRLTVGPDGVVSETTSFWLTPWVKSRETAPLSRVASIQHDKGLLWDRLIVETSGGTNTLDIDGVAKGPARRFVTAANAMIEAAHRGG